MLLFVWHRSQVGASPRATGPCKPAAPAHLAAAHGRVCLLPRSSSKSPAADFSLALPGPMSIPEVVTVTDGPDPSRVLVLGSAPPSYTDGRGKRGHSPKEHRGVAVERGLGPGPAEAAEVPRNEQLKGSHRCTQEGLLVVMGKESYIKVTPQPWALTEIVLLLGSWSVPSILWFCQAKKENFKHILNTLWLVHREASTWFWTESRGRNLFWFLDLFPQHIGSTDFCGNGWLEVAGQLRVSPGGAFTWVMLIFGHLPQVFVLNPVVSCVRSWPLCAQVLPLAGVWCSFLQQFLTTSWLGKKMEGGEERKQKQFTLRPPKDRSVTLPWPQKFTEEVGESGTPAWVFLARFSKPLVSCIFLFLLLLLFFQGKFTNTKKREQYPDRFPQA